jgi:hypothetical protein
VASELLPLYRLSEELQDVANSFDTSTFLAGNRKGATTVRHHYWVTVDSLVWTTELHSSTSLSFGGCH